MKKSKLVVTNNHIPTTIHFSFKFYNMIKEIHNENCRIATIVLKALHCERYLNPDKKFDYLSFREKDGLISFMPYGKEQERNSEGLWSRKGRQEVKPVRFVRDFLHPRILKKFKDHEIAEFSTKFKAFEEKQAICFELTTAEKSYDRNYHQDSETYGSCMADKDVGKFYKEVGALVLVAYRKGDPEKKFLGRALFWPKVKFSFHTQEVPFLDRIYAKNVEIVDLFKQWAVNNKCFRKAAQNNDCCEFVSPDEVIFFGSITVDVEKSIWEKDLFFPYLDTFAYGDNEVMFFNDESRKVRYSLRNTDGSLDRKYVIAFDGSDIPVSTAVSVNLGENYNQEEITHIHHYDNTNPVRAYFPLDHPDICCAYGHYDWRLKNDPDIDNIQNPKYDINIYYLKKDLSYHFIRDFEGNWIPRTDAVFCEDDGQYYHCSEYGNILNYRNGCYFLKKNQKKKIDFSEIQCTMSNNDGKWSNIPAYIDMIATTTNLYTPNQV